MKHISKLITIHTFLAIENMCEFDSDSRIEVLNPKIIHSDFLHVWFEKPSYKLINNNELCGKMLSNWN